MKKIALVAAGVILAFGVAFPGLSAAAGQAEAGKHAKVKVAVYIGPGAKGIGAVEWLRIVEESPEMELKLVTGKSIAEGALDGQDVLVMPGGNSIKQFHALGEKGAERLKSFVREGGGYVGTCAGCSILLNEGKNRLRMIPYRRIGWAGLFYPKFHINALGAKSLGITEGRYTIRYNAGPIVEPYESPECDGRFEVWGTYAFEASNNGRANRRMFGTPAIVGGTFGKGRVFATVAHPEYFEETLPILEGAFKYVTGRDVTFPPRKKKRGAVTVAYFGEEVRTQAIAEMILSIDARQDMYLVPVDMAIIRRRRIDNIDVLLVSDRKLLASAKKGASIRRTAEEFMERGGSVIYCGDKGKGLPEGVVTADPGCDVIKAIKSVSRFFRRRE